MYNTIARNELGPFVSIRTKSRIGVQDNSELYDRIKGSDIEDGYHIIETVYIDDDTDTKNSGDFNEYEEEKADNILESTNYAQHQLTAADEPSLYTEPEEVLDNASSATVGEQIMDTEPKEVYDNASNAPVGEPTMDTEPKELLDNASSAPVGEPKEAIDNASNLPDDGPIMDTAESSLDVRDNSESINIKKCTPVKIHQNQLSKDILAEFLPPSPNMQKKKHRKKSR